MLFYVLTMLLDFAGMFMVQFYARDIPIHSFLSFGGRPDVSWLWSCL